MSKFLAGFGLASAVWIGAALGLHFMAGWGPPLALEETMEVVEASSESAPTADPRRGRRARGGRSDRGSRGASVPHGNATTGDDLRENEMRMIDGAGSGGEQQLTGAQIDSAWDGAIGRVRRCLILAAGENELQGRVTFGMRISGSGQVTAVNLSGPAVVTSGDCGQCLRDVARSIRFPTFDGPEMLVRYPVELE